jgi:hypothetical protein
MKRLRSGCPVRCGAAKAVDISSSSASSWPVGWHPHANGVTAINSLQAPIRTFADFARVPVRNAARFFKGHVNFPSRQCRTRFVVPRSVTE